MVVSDRVLKEVLAGGLVVEPDELLGAAKVRVAAVFYELSFLCEIA